MIIRHPHVEELAGLMRRLEESGGEVIDLYRTPCWVAEQDGVIVGVLPIALWWRAEPMLVFPEVRNKATRRRACHGMYAAMAAWLRDEAKNTTGVRRVFMTARRVAVRGWATKMGWLHQWRRAPMFIKYF